MNKHVKWIILLLASGILGVATAAVTSQYVIQTEGGISTVGLDVTWLDGSPATNISCGALDNDTAYVWPLINITNTENTPVNLTLSTTNHSASIISLTLTWNYTAGTVILPGQSVIVELTQTVVASGDWSCDTVITATEV